MNRLLLTAVTSAALLAAAPTALAAPGELDTTFSDDGLATVDLTFDGVGVGAATQPDGKLVVLGQQDSSLQTTFQVARFNRDGIRDESFAGDGLASIAFGPAAFANRSHPSAVALQPDGKIVVVGNTDGKAKPGNEHDMAIGRLNADGTLDKTFSGDGKQTIDYGQDDEAIDVAVQTDGKIVVGGRALIGNDQDFAVARLTTEGEFDPTWVGNGRTATHFGAAERLEGITIAPDGQVVAVGTFENVSTDTDTAIARYTTDGRPERSFDGDGKLLFPLSGKDGAVDVAAQRDGKLVLAVAVSKGKDHETIVARLTATGARDDAFGESGTAQAAVEAPNAPAALALTDSGRIVVSGAVLSGPDQTALLALELEPDGRPTRDFSGDGIAQVDRGSDAGRDVALADGRALMVGVDSNHDIGVTALTVDAPPAAQEQSAPAANPEPPAPPPAAPQPPADTTAPILSKLKLKAVRRTEKGAYQLSERATVRVTVQRKIKRGKRARLVAARTITLKGKAGANAFKLTKLKPGSYRVVVTATDAAGNKSKALRRTFRLRR